jgi:hypothetical protein
VLNLIQCLQYLDTLRDRLLEDSHSNDVITSTTARILLYNVFDQKVLNLNLTNIKLPINMNEINLNNLTINNITLF